MTTTTTPTITEVDYVILSLNQQENIRRGDYYSPPHPDSASVNQSSCPAGGIIPPAQRSSRNFLGNLDFQRSTPETLGSCCVG